MRNFLFWLFFFPMLLPAADRHTFSFNKNDFLLDGKPIQLISGELHPARIPVEYWRHRIQMARAMGCNTIAAYLFWNYHEPQQGRFDFSSGNHDIRRFFRTVQEEGMWAILRPGPYVCAEWDFGGLPPYLLAIPDIKVRCMDSRYMAAVERYLTALADEIQPLLLQNGGPILMIQIENEYGSYANDRNYMHRLRNIWIENGVAGPFFTGDGATPYMLEAGSLPNAAIGLDSGSSAADFDQAKKQNPDVVAFSSETYPGWLTHWGESWARPDTAELLKEVRFLMDNKKSFNFYVLHGGTNFGYTAGANSGGKGYEPDVTSYDYDAPVDEQGQPTKKFYSLRKLLTSYKSKGTRLPEMPPAIPAMDVPEIPMQVFTDLWSHLPEPLASVQPKPMEAYGQDYGFVLYKTKLIGHKKGKLTITELHDYATIFLNGSYIGKIDRRLGEQSIELPKTDATDPELEILVEGMGRINYGPQMIDRKGITERVTLNNMTLMNWSVYSLPLSEAWLSSLTSTSTDRHRPGLFFKGRFDLTKPADTFFDMSGYSKGLVWVNGHNLGKYWNIGPQKALYCPASWLKTGENEIVVFDQHQTAAKPVRGCKTQI
jgi:beta-galactosidase